MQIKPAFSKTFVFAVHTVRFHLKTHTFSKTSTLGIVFEDLRFQWRFHRFSVRDGRRKRIGKDPFSNVNAFVWMGPYTPSQKVAFLATHLCLWNTHFKLNDKI